MQQFLSQLSSAFSIDTTPITDDDEIVSYCEDIVSNLANDDELSNDEKVESFMSALEGLGLEMDVSEDKKAQLAEMLAEILDSKSEKPAQQKQTRQMQQEQQRNIAPSPRTTVYELFGGAFSLKFIDYSLTRIPNLDHLVNALMDKTSSSYVKLKNDYEKQQRKENIKNNNNDNSEEKYDANVVNKVSERSEGKLNYLRSPSLRSSWLVGEVNLIALFIASLLMARSTLTKLLYFTRFARSILSRCGVEEHFATLRRRHNFGRPSENRESQAKGAEAEEIKRREGPLHK